MKNERYPVYVIRNGKIEKVFREVSTPLLSNMGEPTS